MATITYGSEDAIYGSGVYNEAVYGEFGPTLLIDGVSTTSSVGTLSTSAQASTTLVGVSATGSVGVVIENVTEVLVGAEATSSIGTVQVNISEILTGVEATGASGSFTFVAEANTTVTGAEGVVTEGVIQPSGGASQSLTGVEGTSALGTVVITATVGLAGQQVDSALGAVQVNLIEYITGVTSTGAAGTTEELGKANKTLSSVFATGSAGNTSETAVVFDFEAVKETYDRRRTIKLPRVA